MKKLLTIFAVLLALTSCGVNGSGNAGGSNSNSSTGTGSCGGNLNLDAINEYFKTDPEWANLNANGNKVTLIPFTHINGPKAEWNFFAIVNFEYDATFYYKYQVTYLSCTCRSAEVNYWQTAYVELSVPNSGEADDIKLRTLSFDLDKSGHYLGGFWGDSGVNGYDINGTGMTYEGIKTGFIPYLVGKTKAEISQLSTYDDIDKDTFNEWAKSKDIQVSLLGKDEPELVTWDTFIGSSVSTNNIIRMINALMDYHAANNI